jgi:hypothetical protein
LHRQKLNAWIPQISKVSQQYIEKIIGRNIDANLVKLLVISNFELLNREDHKLEDIFQASLLLEEIFEKMKLKGLLDFDTEKLSHVKNMLYTKTQNLVSVLFP